MKESSQFWNPKINKWMVCDENNRIVRQSKRKVHGLRVKGTGKNKGRKNRSKNSGMGLFEIVVFK